MSRMIPQATVDAMRVMSDISVGNYGIDCQLFIPNNIEDVKLLDAYEKPSDYTFIGPINTQVVIDWKPDKHRLRKLGIVIEDDLPIVAYFPRIVNPADATKFLDITINSYFKIQLQYVQRQYDTEFFEIVDYIVPAMHDSVIVQYFKIAPRRVKGQV